MTVFEFTDPYGNLCQRLVAEAGAFSIQTSAEIECPEASDLGHGAPFTEVND